MNYVLYILKFLFRIKWWLILCPLIVAAIVFLKIGKPTTYRSSTTIYTGIVSGYDIETLESSHQDWNIINNAMDNLMSIIRSQSTLKSVSMRLYAMNMMNGDPKQDNNFITAAHYRDEVNRTPPEVLKLINRENLDSTLDNLRAYEKADHGNHVYGLFHWQHRYYSFEALSKIQVKRIGNSDMLEVTYENDDPGVVYNTLALLNDEFVKQYHDLRFGETNNVIKYFEGELANVGGYLRSLEDSLRDYNIEHRVINYDEQTKHIAALDRDFELYFAEVMRQNKSSEALVSSIEKQINELKSFRINNANFLQKVREISDLQTKIATMQAFMQSDQSQAPLDVDMLKKQMSEKEKELQTISEVISNQKYTKEGVATNSIIQEWLTALLMFEKSSAELKVINDRRNELDKKYTQFSPLGSTLKRKEREIGFSEQSYLSILQALNTARLRQKNLQMTSATLRILNPPVLPIGAISNKRYMLAAASALATLVFVLGLFILLELLDRTLRDRLRTERITGGKVAGAMPGQGRFGDRKFINVYHKTASQYLANALINYLGGGGPRIINFLSTEPGDGKSYICEQLAERLREKGMRVRTVSWNSDFNIESKEYILASKLSDFVSEEGKGNQPALSQADIVLVEYPSFSTASVPRELLRHAAVNLLVAGARRTWKETDQQLFDQERKLAGDTPTVICLNLASREVVESFTGLLPPFTFLRKIGYRLGQMGFTATK